MRLLPGVGRPVSLRALLPDAAIQGAEDILVEACVAQLAEVRPGSLFVAAPAVAGGVAPAIAEAVRRGCAAILTDQPVAPLAVPVCRVRDTRRAYARLCHALAGDPGRKLKVVAIAGTRGKRTTACLVAGVLHAAGCRLGMLGSLGCLDGQTVTQLAHFPPAPDKTATLLARMAANGCTHAIIEAPGAAVLDGQLAGVPLDMLALTWAEDDPEPERPGVPTVVDPRRVSIALHDQLAPGGLAVVNAEDPWLGRYVGEMDGPVLTVGMRVPAEIRGVRLEQDPGGQTFLLVAGSDIMPVAVRTPGQGHLVYCLLAAAIGLAYQVALPTVVRGLESVDRVPARLERIDSGWPLPVFVDGARSAWALEAALGALREAIAGQVRCIVGIDPQADREASRRLIETACQGADTVIVTRAASEAGREPRRRTSGGAASAAAVGGRGETRAARRWLRSVRPWLADFCDSRSVQVVPERFEAFETAVAQGRSGDAVLVLADDAQEVRAWCSRVLPPQENCWTQVCATRGPR